MGDHSLGQNSKEMPHRPVTKEWSSGWGYDIFPQLVSSYIALSTEDPTWYRLSLLRNILPQYNIYFP